MLKNKTTLVHFPKTGGTALGYFIEKNNIDIKHASLVRGDKKSIMLMSKHGRTKHGDWSNSDCITIIRHPTDHLISMIAFRHSGSELTIKFPGTAGGSKKPLTSIQLHDTVMNDRGVKEKLKYIENSLKNRLLQNKFKTHILLTDNLNSSGDLFEELGYDVVDKKFEKQHYSEHDVKDKIFSQADIQNFENMYPFYFKLYRYVNNQKNKYCINFDLHDFDLFL